MALLVAALGACAGGPAPEPRVLVFGEQHDQPDQQRQVAATVERLAADGRLAAVVLEMAERGGSTQGLPRDADPAAVRRSLGWTETAWPWAPYAPVVMAAVQAGVPVWGGNLPRPAMRGTMDDAGLDDAVPPDVAARLDAAIRDGHCGLMPDAMLPAMRRIQVARDRSMAAVVAERVAAGPGTVLLLTGAQHASRDRGVPWQLVQARSLAPADVRVLMFERAGDGLVADARLPAAVTETPDRCEQLRQQLRQGEASR